MTDDEWRWHQLERNSDKLSLEEIQAFKGALVLDQANVDLRVQIIAFFSQFGEDGNSFKHIDAETNLLEQLLWFIENRPSLSGSLAHKLSRLSRRFKPKTFAIARQAWLAKIDVEPLNGTLIGNAAVFLVWSDFESASELFERAYALQPKKIWLGTFTLFCKFEVDGLSIYRKERLERVIEVGLRSLKTEIEGVPFMTAECVADAALALGRLELIPACAEKIKEWGNPISDQVADSYLGLLALRDGQRERAIELLTLKRGYVPQEVVFRLATELFELGERECIASLIVGFKRQLKASVRNRWLSQLANNELPDFDEYCC